MPDEMTEGKLKRNFKKIIIVVIIALIIINFPFYGLEGKVCSQNTMKSRKYACVTR